MIYDGHKWVHFGQMGYEDFTKHKDLKRREKYLTRTAKMNFTPYLLHITIAFKKKTGR